MRVECLLLAPSDITLEPNVGFRGVTDMAGAVAGRTRTRMTQSGHRQAQIGGGAPHRRWGECFLRREFFENSPLGLYSEQGRHHCTDQDHTSEHTEDISNAKFGDDPPHEYWTARGA